jgi:large subunit ribosomal protein L9
MDKTRTIKKTTVVMRTVVSLLAVFTILTVAHLTDTDNNFAGSLFVVAEASDALESAKVEIRKIRALEQKQVLDGKTVKLYGTAGKDGKLSSPLTNKDVRNVIVDTFRIYVGSGWITPQTFADYGVYDAKVKLFREITAFFKVEVLPEVEVLPARKNPHEMDPESEMLKKRVLEEIKRRLARGENPKGAAEQVFHDYFNEKNEASKKATQEEAEKNHSAELHSEMQNMKAQGMKENLDGTHVKIYAPRYVNGKMKGSISSKELARAIEEACGITINKKALEPQSLEKFGTYDVKVKLYGDKIAVVKVEVLPQNN